jgi:hypothetical protein
VNLQLLNIASIILKGGDNMFTGNPQHRNKSCFRNPFRSWQFRARDEFFHRKKKIIGC